MLSFSARIILCIDCEATIEGALPAFVDIRDDGRCCPSAGKGHVHRCIWALDRRCISRCVSSMRRMVVGLDLPMTHLRSDASDGSAATSA